MVVIGKMHTHAVDPLIRIKADIEIADTVAFSVVLFVQFFLFTFAFLCYRAD